MKLHSVTTYAGENDFTPRVYRCKDSIKNLKIKVRFQLPKTRNIPIPQFTPRENDKQRTNANDNTPEYEEHTFSWQEKVFSKSEVEFYRHSGNCRTPLQEQYHQEVSEWSDDTGHLFTYIDADGFNEEVSVTTGQQNCAAGNGKLELLKKQSFIRRKPKITQGNIVNDSPSAEAKKQNHSLQICEQLMYIMADLTDISSVGGESTSVGQTSVLPTEVVLCRLSWDRQRGLLTVMPDFSPTSVDGKCEPYLLEVGGDARNACRYWLYHVSEQPDDNIKVPALSLGIGHLSLGTDFKTPEQGTVQLTVLVEIVSASGYDFDGLFIEYCFELPDGWSGPSPALLAGATHRSNKNDKGEAFFGYIFEVELASTDHIETQCLRPQLLMRVASLDSWGRFRVEGYCHVPLPNSTGRHTLSIPSWRFTPDGRLHEMRRFFVGGGCNVSIDIAGVPDAVKGKPVLGKFGLRTISSGTVTVRMDIIHQTSERAEGWGKNVPHHLSSSALLNSVEAVIAAFSRARHRMLRARQGLDVL
ncbi:Meckel syndrome type 1 protein isoform X1 [Schistocerca gregaria]|uniref:Meckel syndrome type 1 protein isoform X1 n=1 Tax=Schistocerca gregaria TaxID=7010 RepID=UPI00211F1757|nr:Meckel syndrome type 1 protein isoform X1 [Schistocerca gregaria]